ncbi:MAG: type II toxin-antitoxin system VapC family toxin [Defluviitaleaceae bacterium]|nr:type II toxin-antitoxin system VapC family toxin [Defluviitaleaceae bacterium]
MLAQFRGVQSSGVAISSITLAELELGVSKSQAVERNRNALLAFSTLVNILPFDISAAAVYGNIRATLEKRVSQ